MNDTAVPANQGQADAVVQATRALSIASLLGLIVLGLAWELWLAPLRPGGSWVFAVNHPIRWIFPDDPGPKGLTATLPYFDRTPYVEVDDNGVPTYVEHHRTIGDRVREIVAAGLQVRDIIEPEWPEWLDREWGQWSPLRGQLFPGTAIFSAVKP